MILPLGVKEKGEEGVILVVEVKKKGEKNVKLAVGMKRKGAEEDSGVVSRMVDEEKVTQRKLLCLVGLDGRYVAMES